MDEIPTKACPLCCERIHAKARKCPHCQHFQNKWTLLAYHPLAAVTPLMMALVISFAFLTRVFNPGCSQRLL